MSDNNPPRTIQEMTLGAETNARWAAANASRPEHHYANADKEPGALTPQGHRSTVRDR